MIDGWTRLAKIIKPDTKNKGLVLDFSASSFLLPDDIDALIGVDMCIAPPEHDMPRFVSFVSFNKLPKNKFLAKLNSEHRYEDYFPLCGKSVLCNVDNLEKVLKPESIEKFNALSTIGKHVVDCKFGYIGKVNEILETPAHLTLSVIKEDKEILIPMVKEFIKDTEQDEIIVNIPKSLLELNGGDNAD